MANCSYSSTLYLTVNKTKECPPISYLSMFNSWNLQALQLSRSQSLLYDEKQLFRYSFGLVEPKKPAMSSFAPPEIFANPELYASWLAESQEAVVIGVVSFVLFIATCAVAARVYTRLILIKQFGIDDIFAILSLILVIATGATIVYMTNYGLGRHVDFSVTLDDSETGFPTLYLRVCFYNSLYEPYMLFKSKIIFCA